ncbi:unnamed protein product [Chrysoparadoxa australica]
METLLYLFSSCPPSPPRDGAARKEAYSLVCRLAVLFTKHRKAIHRFCSLCKNRGIRYLKPLPSEEEPGAPRSSLCLKVYRLEDAGRHMVARKRLRAGDVLLTEEPVAWALNASFSGILCRHCMWLIEQCGCKKAEQQACMKAGWLDLVPAECRAAAALWERSEDLSLLLDSINLEEHWELRDWDALYRMTCAAALTVALSMQSEGGVEGHVESSRKARALLRTLVIFSTNSFAISGPALSPGMGALEEILHSRFGVGLYPTAALFNHSCRPNALVSFYGTKIIVQACAEVMPGEALVISYGPLASKNTLKHRQQSLRRSHCFACKCKACAQESSRSGAQGTGLKCRSCPCDGELLREGQALVCQKCQSTQAVESHVLHSQADSCARCLHPTISLAPQSSSLLDELHREKLVWEQVIRGPEHDEERLIRQCIAWRAANCHNPDTNFMLAEAHDGLARVLARQGKDAEAAKHCLKATKILDARNEASGSHGEEATISAEWFKCAQLYINAGMATESLACLGRAHDLLQLCGGLSTALAAEIEQLERALVHP